MMNGSLDGSISNIWGVRVISFVKKDKITSIFKTNGADIDQMPRAAASGLGLHCLLMSL